MNAVLFDFGGTLDTNGIHWSEKFRNAYEGAGLKIKPEDFREAYVKAEPQMYVEIKRNDDFFTTIQKQSYLQLNYLEKNRNYSFPGTAKGSSKKIAEICYNDVQNLLKTIKEILEDLKKAFRLGVVSNFYGNLDAALESLGILKYFDVTIDSTIAGVSKPDPGIFRLAVEKMNVLANNTIVVGDSYERDIKPAKLLNCRTIWLDVSSWTRPEETKAADFIIKDVMEIKGIIYKLFPR